MRSFDRWLRDRLWAQAVTIALILGLGWLFESWKLAVTLVLVLIVSVSALLLLVLALTGWDEWKERRSGNR